MVGVHEYSNGANYADGAALEQQHNTQASEAIYWPKS